MGNIRLLPAAGANNKRRWSRQVPPASVGKKAFVLEAIAKPDFTVILNEVKDFKPLKIRDSSL